MTLQTPHRILMAFVALVGLLFCTAGALAAFDTAFRRTDGNDVPVKIYQDSDDPCPPLMIISHGLGGSNAGLSDLAKAAEADGYRVIVMEHTESGRKQWRNILLGGKPGETAVALAGDPDAHRARFLDLDAAWNHATSSCKPPFTVLAGHSMGAQTTMMEAGAEAHFGRLGQDRFDAYVALSPQGVGLRYGPDAWRNVRKPVLMVTGTNDKSVDGDYTTRLSAFEGLPPGNKRIAIIDGASHMAIGGHGNRNIRALVPEIVMEFLDAVRQRKTDETHTYPGVTISNK